MIHPALHQISGKALCYAIASIIYAISDAILSVHLAAASFHVPHCTCASIYHRLSSRCMYCAFCSMMPTCCVRCALCVGISNVLEGGRTAAKHLLSIYLAFTLSICCLSCMPRVSCPCPIWLAAMPACFSALQLLLFSATSDYGTQLIN